MFNRQYYFSISVGFDYHDEICSAMYFHSESWWKALEWMNNPSNCQYQYNNEYTQVQSLKTVNNMYVYFSNYKQIYRDEK